MKYSLFLFFIFFFFLSDGFSHQSFKYQVVDSLILKLKKKTDNSISPLFYSKDDNSNPEIIEILPLIQKACIKLFSVSNDSKYLASYDSENQIRIWNISEKKLIKKIKKVEKKISFLVFSNDNKWLIYQGEDNCIEIFDIEKNEIFRKINNIHKKKINDLVINKEKTLAFTCGDDSSIKIWNTTTWECTQKIFTSENEIKHLNLSDDEKYLSCIGNTNKIGISSLISNFQYSNLLQSANNQIFLQKGDFIISNFNHKFLITDITDNKSINSFTYNGIFKDLCYTVSNKYLILADDYKNLNFINLESSNKDSISIKEVDIPVQIILKENNLFILNRKGDLYQVVLKMPEIVLSIDEIYQMIKLSDYYLEDKKSIDNIFYQRLIQQSDSILKIATTNPEKIKYMEWEISLKNLKFGMECFKTDPTKSDYLKYSFLQASICNLIKNNDHSNLNLLFDKTEYKIIDSKTNLLLGVYYRDQQQYEKALKHCEAAYFQDSISFINNLNLGIVLYEKGELNKSLRTFQKLQKQNPTNEIANYYLAIAYFNSGVFTIAEKLFETAISINGKNISALHFLAQIETERGNYKKAESIYLKAIELQPDECNYAMISTFYLQLLSNFNSDSDYFANFEKFFYKSLQFKKTSISDFEKLIIEIQKFMEMRFYLNKDEDIKLLLESIPEQILNNLKTRKEPIDLMIYDFIINKTIDFNKYKNYYEKSYNKKSDFNLAILLYNNNLFNECLTVCNHLIQNFSYDIESYKLLFQVNKKLRDQSAIAKIVENGIQIFPESPIPYFYAAQVGKKMEKQNLKKGNELDSEFNYCKFALDNISNPKSLNEYKEYYNIQKFKNSNSEWIVKQSNKFGLINSFGELICPIDFDSISYCGADIYCGYKKNLLSSRIIVWFNTSGELQTTVDYENIIFWNKIFLLTSQQKMGLISFKGEILIPFEYQRLYFLDKNNIEISIENKMGCYSLKSRSIIIEPDYDELALIHNTLIMVRKDNKFGSFNAEGGVFLPIEYFSIEQGFFNNIKALKVVKSEKDKPIWYDLRHNELTDKMFSETIINFSK